MDFYSTFRRSKPRPWKERSTQINRGCVQSVNSFVKLETKVIIGIEFPGLFDQHLRKVTINTLVPLLVGIGESASGDF